MHKHYGGAVLFLALLILIIPAFALVGQDRTSSSAADPPIAGFPAASQQDPEETGIPTLTQEDYDNNNFYLVYNHETGQVMALTPADYIKGVVAGEMPASYHPEALKAQAVAAHTYALRQIGEQLDAPDPELQGAYLSTDPARFQAWLSTEDMRDLWGDNFDTYYRKISDAVDAVIRKVILYDEEPIAAAFHAISSGRTESAAAVWGQELPYLTPVDSEGDELSPDYQTETVLTREEVAHALVSAFPQLQLPEDPAQWFVIRERSDSGTVSSLQAGSLLLSGREVREALGLRSANFTVTYAEDAFHFLTIGYGHDVGMSQYGADYLARQGNSWEEILLHYYTGVHIEDLS